MSNVLLGPVWSCKVFNLFYPLLVHISLGKGYLHRATNNMGNFSMQNRVTNNMGNFSMQKRVLLQPIMALLVAMTSSRAGRKDANFSSNQIRSRTFLAPLKAGAFPRNSQNQTRIEPNQIQDPRKKKSSKVTSHCF